MPVRDALLLAVIALCLGTIALGPPFVMGVMSAPWPLPLLWAVFATSFTAFAYSHTHYAVSLRRLKYALVVIVAVIVAYVAGVMLGPLFD